MMMRYSLSLMSGGFARWVIWSSNREELIERANRDRGCGRHWLLGSYDESGFLGYERI